MSQRPSGNGNARAPRHRTVAIAIRAALIASLIVPFDPAHGGAVFDLATLDGSNGVKLDNSADTALPDSAGSEVAGIGDINGDAIDDVVLGARQWNGFGQVGAGFVVFGRSTAFAATLPLPSLDGSNGFLFHGKVGFDHSGSSIDGDQDVNGDGRADFLLNAPDQDLGSGNIGDDFGAVYVVFGRAAASPFPAVLPAANLDGSIGFEIRGAAVGDYLSAARMAGDINDDGIGDILVGAGSADPGMPARAGAGAAYVIFGRPSGSPFASFLNVSSLNGSNGFRLEGVAADDFAAAYGVAAAGDLNGDGADDLMIGASGADPGGRSGAGSAYVVFGHSGAFPASFALSTLDGSNGFRMDGLAADDHFGQSMAPVGDINGDGRDDILVSASYADPGGLNAAGSAYVVFGRSSFTASVDLAALNGTAGFRVDGFGANGYMGYGASAAGDVNGDGFDDLIVGAGSNGNDHSCVVFGRATAFPAVIDLSTLNGADGFRINGPNSSGSRVAAAGDFNNDGLDDLIISAGQVEAAHVLFGNSAPLRMGGAGAQNLGAVLEGAGTPAGSSIASATAPRYLDTVAIAGAAITTTPGNANGVWQYSLDGNNFLEVPAGLAANNALVLAANSQLRFVVSGADFFGDSPPLALRMWDGTDTYTAGTGRDIRASIGSLGGFSNDANVLSLIQPVTPVNDAPSFTAASPPALNEDAGAQSLQNFVSAFSPGPANEAGQTVLEYLVTAVSNPTLFAAQPAVASNGTLTYTPAANAFGTATFDLQVRDSGGTTNGGVNTSPPQTVTITINSVNDPPSFTAGNPPAVDENAGAQMVPSVGLGFIPGPVNESGQTLVEYLISAVSNPALFAVQPTVANDGTLSYTPAANTFGTSTFQLRVRDSGGTAFGGTDTSVPLPVTITVNAVAEGIFCNGFENVACTPAP